MMVDAAALTRCAPRFEEPLNSVECVLIDDGLMSSPILLPFVRRDADVVRVPQDSRERLAWDRFGRLFGCPSRHKAALFAVFGEFLDGDIAFGILLEGVADERCSLGINGDGADFSALGAVDHVEIPNGCSPQRSALPCLLTHFVGDVGAVFSGAVFVEGGEDAVHELPDGGVVDLLGGRNQCDPSFLEVGHDDGVVDAVAGEP
ncbi:hypothetical protein V3H80_19085 [Gordonia polyisoprenivorans]|nr:hypothetical protein [Gordonia polyisoprenivorans]